MVLFLLPSCKPACSAQKIVSESLASVIVTTLGCSNPDKVQSDISSILDKANLCTEQKMQGPIANIACPIVAQAAVSALGNQVPASWGCNNTNQVLSFAITQACQLLPF